MAVPIYGIHVWSEDDTWWDISFRYTGSGLNWVWIVWANPHVHNPNKVVVGTKIHIPEELTR